MRAKATQCSSLHWVPLFRRNRRVRLSRSEIHAHVDGLYRIVRRCSVPWVNLRQMCGRYLEAAYGCLHSVRGVGGSTECLGRRVDYAPGAGFRLKI